MRVITTIKDMQEYSRAMQRDGRSIGFVPTMGYLHEGHLSLVRASKKECDVTVASIFVNPTQFGPGEDLDKYPRDLEMDKDLLEKESVDVLFVPAETEMYPEGTSTYINVEGGVTQGLCASSRQGHFRGVATVVNKLFNITMPDAAFFGQKDGQQAAVIKRMVRDLDMPVEVRVIPIVRDIDGLAMSSRNSYLSDEQRREALRLYGSLKRAEEMVLGGESSAVRVKEEMRNILQEGKDVRVDYVEVVDADDMAPLDDIRDNTMIAVAAYVGGTRLIDNIIVNK